MDLKSFEAGWRYAAEAIIQQSMRVLEMKFPIDEITANINEPRLPLEIESLIRNISPAAGAIALAERFKIPRDYAEDIILFWCDAWGVYAPPP